MPARPSSARRRAVTARVATRASKARDSRTSLFCLGGVSLLAFSLAAPARAAVGATASIFSDDRFRGYSLSDGRPIGVLDFAYDDPSGLYADATLTGVLARDDVPAPLGAEVSGGYARRLNSGTTLDFGITHTTYSHYSSGKRGSSYTEVYAGIARGALSSRIFLSPHYFADGRWTAYGEINGSISPASNWSLDGHVGLLVPLRSGSTLITYRPDFDWRVGVTRELGRISLHASWTDGAGGQNYHGQNVHGRSAVVVGVSLGL